MLLILHVKFRSCLHHDQNVTKFSIDFNVEKSEKFAATKSVFSDKFAFISGNATFIFATISVASLCMNVYINLLIS